MEIIKTTSGLSQMELYKMTRDPGIKSMSGLENDTTLDFMAYVIYSDLDNTGAEMELLSIMTNEGIFATNSKPFIEDFKDVMEIFGDNLEGVTKITVLKGTSKNNRTYLRCSVS